MYKSHYINLHSDLLKEAALSVNPNTLKMLGVGLGSAGLGAMGSHYLTHAIDEKQRQQTRNRAFGAGVGAGVVAPRIVQHLFDIAQNTGFLPSGR